MVLSVYIHHSVIDGVGFDKFYKLWSTHVRNFQDGKHSSPPQDCSSPRRALDAMIPPVSLHTASHCPELSTTASKPSTHPLRITPYTIVSRILIFPASEISRLRADLQSQTPVRISPFESAHS
jgi:hypothetical protein